MAVFRIMEAKARPGALDRVAELLVRQNDQVVTSAPGALFAHALRSGDQVLAVSSWRSTEDMQRYLEREVTREFYRALSHLVMGLPSVRTYEVITGGADATGWVADESAADGGRR